MKTIKMRMFFKTISEIRDSRKVVDLVKKYRPDVIITDIML